MGWEAMTSKLGLLAGAVLIASIAVSSAYAAQGVPEGTYARTCRNIENQGGNLVADCLRVSGQWRTSTLELGRCDGKIANVDGRLSCHGSNNERISGVDQRALDQAGSGSSR